MTLPAYSTPWRIDPDDQDSGSLTHYFVVDESGANNICLVPSVWTERITTPSNDNPDIEVTTTWRIPIPGALQRARLVCAAPALRDMVAAFVEYGWSSLEADEHAGRPDVLLRQARDLLNSLE